MRVAGRFRQKSMLEKVNAERSTPHFPIPRQLCSKLLYILPTSRFCRSLQQICRERELETNLLHELERLLLELGQGFTFVGRQVHLHAGDNDFLIDLVFDHLKLRCLLLIDLKKGAFKPEYAAKMNFYLGVADDRLRHESDQPSIGLILCQDRNRVIAEYALRGMSKLKTENLWLNPTNPTKENSSCTRPRRGRSGSRCSTNPRRSGSTRRRSPSFSALTFAPSASIFITSLPAGNWAERQFSGKSGELTRR